MSSIKTMNNASTKTIINMLNQKVNENKNNYLFCKMMAEQIEFLEISLKKKTSATQLCSCNGRTSAF